MDLLAHINRRKKQILVHSFLYYQMNTNVISDHTYDAWCKELAELLVKHPEVAKKSVYYKEFLTFDGSSGFDLPYSNPEIQSIARMILQLHTEGGNQNGKS